MYENVLPRRVGALLPQLIGMETHIVLAVTYSLQFFQ